jgi:hypothetical protein
MLNSIQQCEEWQGFEFHGCVQHARELGWEHTCDSVSSSKMVPHHTLHESIWTRYAIVSALPDLNRSCLNWPLRSPDFSDLDCICGVIWRIAYWRRGLPLWWIQGHKKLFVAWYSTWRLTAQSAPRVHHCGRGAFAVFCFKKVNYVCMKLISKISFTWLCDTSYHLLNETIYSQMKRVFYAGPCVNNYCSTYVSSVRAQNSKQ